MKEWNPPVKVLVVVFAVVMMIAGGTLSFLKWAQIGPFAAEAEVVEETVISEDPSAFIELDPLTVNIFQDKSVAALVQIGVKLEVKGDRNVDLVNRRLPRITNTFLQDLHGYLPHALKKKDSQIKAFVLKKRLKLLADKLFPGGEVHDVLIQSINVSGG